MKLVLASVCALVCVCVAACGQTAPAGVRAQADPAWARNLRPCLQTAGAKVATSSTDVDFTRKDVRTLSLATARTLRTGSSAVYELQPEKSSSGNYRIFIQAANPDNAPSISTANVLRHPRSVQLVAYMRDPPVGELQAAESCLGSGS